jgi:hypothetical protein
MLVDTELDADTELEVTQVDKRIDRGRGRRFLRRETRDAGRAA